MDVSQSGLFERSTSDVSARCLDGEMNDVPIADNGTGLSTHRKRVLVFKYTFEERASGAARSLWNMTRDVVSEARKKVEKENE